MISESKEIQIKNRYKSNGHKFPQVVNQDEISISQLRANLSGRVITPEDAEYNAARTLFAGGFDRRPAFIIRVAGASDVSAVVMFARETGFEIAVRSGGHSPAGHSVVEGGIVIDLRDMKDNNIDTVNHTAWAETGMTASEYMTATGVYGLVTGFGDTGSVGI
jgi:FAD/FMN-containing dehydrogenase